MGASSVLGNVAAGYSQAAELDRKRQFEAEQDRRRQISDFLMKLAGDDTARPESRQAATQELLALHGSPWNKPYKFDANKLLAPYVPKQTLQPPGAPPGAGTAQTVTPAAQGAGEGSGGPAALASSAGGNGQAHPPMLAPPEQPPALSIAGGPDRLGAVLGAPTSAVSLANSEQPRSIWMSPDERAEHEHIIRQGELSAQMGGSTYTRAPDGSLVYQPISAAGTPMPGISHAVSPYEVKPPLREITVLDDSGNPIPATRNLLTGQVTDSTGKALDNPKMFNGRLVGSTLQGFQWMDENGNIHTESTRTPNVKGPALAAPTAPPGATAQKPTGAAKAGTPSKGTQSPQTAWMDAKDPVTLDAARAVITGDLPKETKARRQVLMRVKQLGLGIPPVPVPPALQEKIQQSFVARNSAIRIIDDIVAHKDVFNSLIDSGAIDLAAEPNGMLRSVISRSLDGDAARVAGDFQQLTEHANLLRGPLGATGFRGEQAWQALQAQRGKALQNPAITMQVLTGMRSRLVGLNSADKMILEGKGMTAPGSADPSTHVFDAKAWKVANPGGDLAAAKKYAASQGYEVKE